MEVHGLAGCLPINNELEQIVAERRDGLPFEHHSVRLVVNQLQHRVGREGDVGRTLDVTNAGAEHGETAVERRGKVERYDEGPCSRRHLLVQHVAQVCTDARVGVHQEISGVVEVKVAEVKRPLGDGVHREVHRGHLDSITVHGVGKTGGDEVERGRQLTR